MTVRLMNAQDYDQVYALWMACKGVGLNSVDDSREGITRFLARNPESCFVSEEDGRITGVILTGNDGRRGYIYHTAVSPDCRRQGVGAALVEAALGALRALGISKVALVAFQRNEAGNRFWQEQGFTVRDDLVYRNKLLSEMVRYDT